MAAIYTKKADGTWQRKIAKGAEPERVTGLKATAGNLWQAAGNNATRFPFNLDLTGVTSLVSGFSGSAALTEGPTLETSKVTNVSSLFQGCTSLTRVPDYDLSSATTAATMFYGCTSLAEVPRLKASPALKDTTNMFRFCTSLKELGVFDTSGVTAASAMFSDSGLEVLPAFDFRSLTTAPGLPATLRHIEGTNFTALTSLALGLANLESANIITGPRLHTVSFGGASKLQFVSLSDTSGVTNWSNAFNGCSSLVMPPVLDTRSATTMATMFMGCSGLTQAPRVTTDKCTSTWQMFMGCSGIMYWDPTPLNMPLVTSTLGMFRDCRETRDVPDMTTSSALRDTSYMFASCEQLQRVPLFDTSAVTTVTGMFQYCRNLWEIPAYDFSNAGSSTSGMFSNMGSLTRIRAFGFRYSINVSGNQLGTDALSELLANMGTPATATRVVTISGNPGAETCDRTPATSKGWTVIG